MFLTDFADAAVTLPLAALVAVGLLACAGVRVMASWLLAVGVTFAGIMALKLAFGFSPWLQAATGVVSPSGHTACSTVVYAGLVRLFGGGRGATVASAVVVAVVVGASRLALGAHTPAETVLGALDGLAGVALLLRLVTSRALAEPRPRAALACAAALLVAALHGRHAPFEGMLQRWRECASPVECGMATVARMAEHLTGPACRSGRLVPGDAPGGACRT